MTEILKMPDLEETIRRLSEKYHIKTYVEVLKEGHTITIRVYRVRQLCRKISFPVFPSNFITELREAVEQFAETYRYIYGELYVFYVQPKAQTKLGEHIVTS